MWLRAKKNQRNLYGLHGPATVLTHLVPPGRPAVDAGAASGLYAYFIGTQASAVHAFEPNPNAFLRMRNGAGNNIRTYNVALSNKNSTATLHVPPAGLGEASLEQHPNRGLDIQTWEVETRTLDSFHLKDVGFLKIDVEGHEEALLDGATVTIEESRPTIFIEVEERHSPGSVGRVLARMRTEMSYTQCYFLLQGRFCPIEQFDIERHQLSLASTPRCREYVNNFLFKP